jgi:adenosylhomocysteine nucleosidase
MSDDIPTIIEPDFDGEPLGEPFGGGAADGSLAQGPGPVAIFVAVELEARALCRRLGQSPGRGRLGWQGTFGRDGRTWIMTRTGMGRRMAADSVRAVLQMTSAARPSAVLCCGLAGGLKPTLAAGDVLIARRVYAEESLSSPRFSVFRRRPPEGDGPVKYGDLFTADRVVSDPAAKAELFERTACLAVDMESAAVAEQCHRARVPFLAVRGISDAAGDSLPPELPRIVDDWGNPRWLRLLGAMLRRPSLIGDLTTLRRRAELAAERMADTVGKLLEAM